MLEFLSRFNPKKIDPLKNSQDLLLSANPRLVESLINHEFHFQQDIVEEIRAHQKRKIPTQDSLELSSTVCAGICYWTALSLLGIQQPSIVEFIEEIYQEKNDIKHSRGVDHIEFLQYLGKKNPDFYGLSVNPFREHTPKKYLAYRGYYGKDSEKFFKRVYKEIKNTSSLAKLILKNGGLAVTSIQATFNNYSPSFHDILIVGYYKPSDSFVFLDPDARVYFNTQKERPPEIIPLPKFRCLYTVKAAYLDKHTYRTKPSPGGIVIGLFKSQDNPKPPTPTPLTSHSH